MTNDRSLLFCDIDGVVGGGRVWAQNETKRWTSPAGWLDPVLIARLNRLVRRASADVVWATSWRTPTRTGSSSTLGSFLVWNGLARSWYPTCGVLGGGSASSSTRPTGWQNFTAGPSIGDCDAMRTTIPQYILDRAVAEMMISSGTRRYIAKARSFARETFGDRLRGDASALQELTRRFVPLVQGLSERGTHDVEEFEAALLLAALVDNEAEESETILSELAVATHVGLRWLSGMARDILRERPATSPIAEHPMLTDVSTGVRPRFAVGVPSPVVGTDSQIERTLSTAGTISACEAA